MSEVKRTFMQELNLWSEANVISPLGAAAGSFEEDEQGWESTGELVKKAIREKVLESYKNGLKTGAGAVRKELRRGAAPAMAVVQR